MATMSDESKYPTRIAPYGLRMPPDLKERVEAAAKFNNRSMNAEIVATLEEKYPAPTPFGDALTAAMRAWEEVIREMEEINVQMRSTKDPKEVIRLSDRFDEIRQDSRRYSKAIDEAFARASKASDSHDS